MHIEYSILPGSSDDKKSMMHLNPAQYISTTSEFIFITLCWPLPGSNEDKWILQDMNFLNEVIHISLHT